MAVRINDSSRLKVSRFADLTEHFWSGKEWFMDKAVFSNFVCSLAAGAVIEIVKVLVRLFA